MLEGSGLSATRLIALMRKDFGLSASFSVEEARLVLGVQYEIRSRNLAGTDPYVLAEDIDAELISLLNDGDYAGAKITPLLRAGVRDDLRGRISWGISEKSTTVRKRRPWARI